MKLSKEQIEAFRRNERVNPLTGRSIEIGKRVHRQLTNACKDYEKMYEQALDMFQNMGLNPVRTEKIDDNFSLSVDINNTEDYTENSLDAISNA